MEVGKAPRKIVTEGLRPSRIQMPGHACYLTVTETKVNKLHRASVCRGKFGGKMVAVKKMDLPQVKNDEFLQHQELNHENVVKLLAMHKDDNFLYLILELCAASLNEFVKGKYQGPMPSDVDVMIQISRGLQYFHQKGIAHGGVMPDNILISQQEPVCMKLSGYAFNQLTKGGFRSRFSKERTWSLSWASPEIIQSLRPSDRDPDLPVNYISGDVFAVGCIFFYFLTKQHPFGAWMEPDNIEDNNPVLMKKLAANHFAYDAIAGMIKPQVERLDINQVLEMLNDS